MLGSKPQRPRRNRRLLLWTLLLVLVAVMVWATVSDSTGAQRVQGFFGLKQDRSVVDSTFSVGPHTFRYYKFALPEGSVNVAVAGQFSSSAEGAGNGKNPDGDKSATDPNVTDRNKDAGLDNGIQVFVLTEAAFVVWRNGSAIRSLYDSGDVHEGKVQADIPAGAGIYYLVFSNKAAPKVPKAVHARVLLRYRSWLRRVLTREQD
jgi:hypothetical protein